MASRGIRYSNHSRSTRILIVTHPPTSTTPMDPVTEALKKKVARRGIHYSLDRLTPALHRLGNPHQHLPTVIHIAGTNGKGSVAHYITRGYMEGGRHAITYTSPHLFDYRERLCWDGTPIPMDAWSALFDTVNHADPLDELSEFECLTLMAFVWARDQSPDVLILETGIGGRLDATNVVPDSTAVITDIGLDHQALLGPSLTDITKEKAGIIKPNSDVITHSDHPKAVMDELLETIRHQQARWHPVPRHSHFHDRNHALAMTTLTVMKQPLPDPSTMAPPFGRLTPTTLWGVACYVDVGHNVAAAQAILQSHHTVSHWIIGMQASKDIAAVVSLVMAHGASVQICDFHPGMAASCQDVSPVNAPSVTPWSLGDPIAPHTLFFGSFYFIEWIMTAHD